MSARHTTVLDESAGTAQVASRPNRGRTRAVLAGGLVLGVGLAATLAAWNDSVNVNGGFATGNWNVQGNVSSPYVDSPANWQEYSSLPGGSMTFQLNPTNLAPGETVYAPVALRVDPNRNTNDAEVVLDDVQFSGVVALGDALSYEVRSGVAATECNDDDFAGTGTSFVPAGTAVDTGSGATSVTLEDDSTVVPFCFAVTLDPAADDTLQNQSGTVFWPFQAESVTSS